MNNFLDVARDLRYSGALSEGENRHFDRVFGAKGKLQAVHSKAELDFENIERLFAAFEMADLINRFPRLGSDKRFDALTTKDLISSLKRLIVVTLEHSLKFTVGNERFQPRGVINSLSDMIGHVTLPFHPHPSYSRFRKLLYRLITDASPAQSTSVLTFNYDLALDYTFYYDLSHAGFEIEQEMSETPLFGEPPNYFLDDRDRGYPLLKLHGSLNWGYCSSCNQVVPWYPSDWPWQEVKNDGLPKGKLRIGQKIDLHEHRECGQALDPEPVVIPPTWSKSAHHNRLSRVWSQAAEELSDADHIVVIGYSLPESDAFFRYLYGLGTVGEQALRSFSVYDPNPEGVKERFEDLLGPGVKLADRFRVFDLNFNEAIKHLSKQFLPDE